MQRLLYGSPASGGVPVSLRADSGLRREPDPASARKLLDGAVEMSAAVHPETAVAALLRAGITYGTLDRKTGVALLHRAFAGVPSVANEDVREEYASGIVRAAADLDAQAATELLRQLPKPASAATAVIRQLLADKHFDQAMELLALMPDQVEYPYEAASYLMANLPAEDPRRGITFGRATTAFARVPYGPFPVLVERFGKQMTADLRGRAVSVMLQRIQAWKDSGDSFSGSADGDDRDILRSTRLSRTNCGNWCLLFACSIRQPWTAFW